MKTNPDDPNAEPWGEDGYVGNAIRLALVVIGMLAPLWLAAWVCYKNIATGD